jgi:tRNA (guanine37-N1)-methyltransferase
MPVSHLRFDVLTIFPAMVAGPIQESIIRRAIDDGLITVRVHNIRDFALDKHHSTDDTPYGGGAGMVMRPGPVFAAASHAIADAQATGEAGSDSTVVLLTPQGRQFTQTIAAELAERSHIVLVSGRYEGFDERVREHLATDEISIGDYVLTGGELPALVVLDAVARLVPGVLDAESLAEESISSGLLEYPHYTRPADFRGWTVPDVLLSGNHAAIARWRRQQALLRTVRRRPDLLARAELSTDDRRFLDSLRPDEGKDGPATS